MNACMKRMRFGVSGRTQCRRVSGQRVWWLFRQRKSQHQGISTCWSLSSRLMFEEIWTRLHTHDTLSDHIQKTRVQTRVRLPSRIRERWFSIHDNSGQIFCITKALSETKVSAKEFKKCWKRVQPMIPEEDLLRLLKKAFGSGHNLSSKVDFIKDIVRRCQDMGEPVRECVVFLSFVSMCCVCLLLSQCVIPCVLVALTDWTMTDTAYLTGFVCLIRLRSTPPPRFLDVLEPFIISHVWRNMNTFAHPRHFTRLYSEDQLHDKRAITPQRKMA